MGTFNLIIGWALTISLIGIYIGFVILICEFIVITFLKVKEGCKKCKK